MEYRQTDILLRQLSQLKQLPRPVLGQHGSLPNQLIPAPHRHPWVQLSYAAEGVLTVETTRARYVVPPDKGVWIPPGLEHSVQCAADTQIRSLYLAPGALPARPCGVLAISPLLRELILAFSRFEVEYDEAGAEGRLVQVMLDQLGAAPDCDLMLPWPEDARLTQLCRYLAEHPDCRRPLAELAAGLGLSDKTLTRLFMKHTGMSFRQWRQRCRLLAALPLLEQHLRITDVAVECGYDSLSAFIAAFGELMGCTPGEYAKKQRLDERG